MFPRLLYVYGETGPPGQRKLPEANVRVYYMDVRAFGKGFEEFYDRVRQESALCSRQSLGNIQRGDKLVIKAEDTLRSTLLKMKLIL